MKKFKVCVVENDAEYRSWMVKEINASESFKCVGNYELASEALFHIPTILPHILIMDLDLESSSTGGSVCMLNLKIINQGFRIMVITSFKEGSVVLEDMGVEVEGYILKRSVPDDLIELLTDTINEKSLPSFSIPRTLEDSVQQYKDDFKNLQSLSKREIEILGLLSMGRLNKEIGDELNISGNTVKGVVYNIYKKLQVKNRVEAVVKYKNLV